MDNSNKHNRSSFIHMEGMIEPQWFEKQLIKFYELKGIWRARMLLDPLGSYVAIDFNQNHMPNSTYMQNAIGNCAMQIVALLVLLQIHLHSVHKIVNFGLDYAINNSIFIARGSYSIYIMWIRRKCTCDIFWFTKLNHRYRHYFPVWWIQGIKRRIIRDVNAKFLITLENCAMYNKPKFPHRRNFTWHMSVSRITI